jgi:hypothetical protein
MALARCEKCGRPDGRGVNAYGSKPHFPVGHPNSGVVCGTSNCENPAAVWLTEEEDGFYKKGKRVFPITGGHNATKFRVQ